MFVVVVAGHFPVQSRAEKFRSFSGLMVLWGSICIVAISVLGMVYLAVAALPFYAVIIGGGLMVLVAPLAVQPFPNRVVDARVSLVGLAVVSLVLCLAALQLM